MITVGLPLRSNWTQSWVIHDVQEPQSAVQPMAASQFFTRSSSSFGELGMEPL